MTTKSLLRSLVACVIASLLTGCGDPPSFQIETVIHPDGSCDRSIWQPKEQFLPASAFSPEWNERWIKVTNVLNRPGSTQEPGTTSSHFHYFTATGSFAHPRNIPPHYHLTAKEAPELGSSDLEQTYVTKDFGLFVEHRWQEKITDIVTMSSFVNARDELLDRLVPIWIDALEKIFGSDYDLSQLTTFIRSDARRMLDNMTVICYDAASRGQVFANNDRLRPEVIDRLLDQAQRAGFDRALLIELFTNKSDDPAQIASFTALLQKCVSQYFRHHDGKPLSAAEAADLVRAILDGRRYKSAIERQRKRMNWLSETNKPLAQQIHRTLLKMAGLYFPYSLFNLTRGGPFFHFEATLPGETIETNGVTITPGRIRWQFTGLELFPSGFAMKARSIVINRAQQQKVLGRVVVATNAQAIEVIDLTKSEPSILEAVQKLAQSGDRTLLEQLKPSTPEVKHRLDKLLESLAKP